MPRQPKIFTGSHSHLETHQGRSGIDGELLLRVISKEKMVSLSLTHQQALSHLRNSLEQSRYAERLRMLSKPFQPKTGLSGLVPILDRDTGVMFVSDVAVSRWEYFAKPSGEV